MPPSASNDEGDTDDEVSSDGRMPLVEQLMQVMGLIARREADMQALLALFPGVTNEELAVASDFCSAHICGMCDDNSPNEDCWQRFQVEGCSDCPDCKRFQIIMDVIDKHLEGGAEEIWFSDAQIVDAFGDAGAGDD